MDPASLGIPIRRLDSIDPPENGCFSFGLIGSTRSGKSTAMLWIWQRWFQKHVTIMMTGSAAASIYKPLAKAAAISPAYYPELIKESMTLNQRTKMKYPTLHILDDLLDGKNSKTMAKLLCIGRNNGLSAIVCAQELMILNCIGRTNLNYVCLFRLNSQLAVEKVVRNYLRHVLPPGPIEEQCKLYNQLTADHYFFCCDFLAGETFLCKLDINEVPGFGPTATK
jgi:hypothetical protein